MKKTLKLIIIGIMTLMVFNLSVFEVNAADGDVCGQVTRKDIELPDCNNSLLPSCNPPTNDSVYICRMEGTQCNYFYAWEDCYYNSNFGNPKCSYTYNVVKLDCSDTTGGGGGGGGFDYATCPSGQGLSCGLPSEAQAQNKYACLYKSYCNNYFFPSLFEAPVPCNENPASAICQSNCSCCPTGSYRSCTQGSQYTVNITIDLTNQSVEERTAAKVSCNQYHGHDDIFVSNVKTRDYYNQWDDHLQDWDLTCIQNTCGCVAPTTATCA